MHLVKLNTPIEYTGLRMSHGIEYLTESKALSSLAILTDGDLEARPIKVHRRDVENPKSILVMRSGGAGDILFLTPVVAALRARFPDAHITLACMPSYHWIFRGQSTINGLAEFPVKMGIAARHDWVLDLENAVESVKDRHVVDLFAERCGVELASGKCVYVPEFSAESFNTQFPKTKKRIGLQWTASSPVRSYPQVQTLMGKLLADGWQVVLYGEPKGAKLYGNPENLINLSDLKWPWHKTIDFLQTCDLVVGPDSSMVHFAGALDIPAIALYGSFDARYRTAYHPSVRVIQATSGCNMAPCFYHMEKGIAMPWNGPCAQNKFCSSLASIEPDEIMAQVKTLHESL